MVVLSRRREHVEPVIGSMSLVGIGQRDFPYSYGNYFSFRNPQYYCANMWAENLTEAVERFNIVTPLEVEVVTPEDNLLQGFALVVDERIPKEWLNQKVCVTGCSSLGVSREELNALMAAIGYQR